MAWLDDEPIRDLNTMEDKVDNPSPQSTLQVLPSFEVYTPPVTHPKEVEETIRKPEAWEIPSFDEPEPQLLPNFSPLDVNLGYKRGTDPLIKPHCPDSFKMKVVDPLTIYTPPSSHMAFFRPKDISCYYHPCLDDPKRHYGFKSSLLGRSGSLGFDFSKLEIIEDDWELEFKEVSFLGRGLNSPVRPKKVIFDEKKLGSA
ncbi:hypothetical protein Tco_0535707 [Tanacetum coccineum]